jgi:predicted transcriptional regulator
VKEVMTAPLVTIGPDEDLMKASEIMHKNNLRRLAVEKSGIIYGIITASDIAQRCGEYVQKTVRDTMRWSFLSG